MNYEGKTPENNENIEGYKVTGDGNVPNHLPQPGNKSFEGNPHAMTPKSEDDIPGSEFNTGDKAFHDSSKKDFVETVSKMHHAEEDDNNEYIRIDMSYKKPDGDR
jgi:hypothetical protein